MNETCRSTALELHKIQLRKKIKAEVFRLCADEKFSEAFAYLLIRQRARDRRQ